MSNPYHWASDLLSRRSGSSRVTSQRRRTSAKSRQLRLFETLEPRIVFASLFANSLAELRSYGLSSNNDTVTLSPSGGDPHPVTGIVTPGEYWINGDHIANPTSSEPTFLKLSGTNNTYNLGGVTINLDTRKMDGFGRSLGHDSGIEVVKISGSGNTINGLELIGHDLAMDTDPNAQRYADWAAVYVQMTGTDNTVDDAHVLSRGSSPYGLSDAFGKGNRSFPQAEPPGQVEGEPEGVVGLPWIGHNKTSAFQVLEATNPLINDMHLDVRTFGHGFFVQKSSDTTLTNSSVTGELISSNDIIASPKYQEYGFTTHGNEIPPDMLLSVAEDGVRLYGTIDGVPNTNFFVDNVVVTNMRSGFATSVGGGIKTLNNVESYSNDKGFGVGTFTTITNAKADIVNGPAVVFPYNNSRDASVEIEIVGGVPVGLDYAVAYLNGQRLDIEISSELALGELSEDSFVRFGQTFFNDWRDTLHPTGPDDGDPGDFIDSTFVNNTNQIVVLGNEVTNNTGSSQAGVISNGKDNQYDGVTLVFDGDRLTVQDVNGMGNGGDATAGTYDSNGTIVFDGATLDINPGLQINDERVTITGDGFDGKGAVYSNGSVNNRTRLVGSGNNSIVVLDGDASIGVGIEGNQLLVGRVSGSGDLTKLGAGILTMEKSSNFDGDLIIAEGGVIGRTSVVRNGLTINSGAWIGANGIDMLDTPVGVIQLDGTLDMNRRTDNNSISGTIGQLNGSGRVTSSNSFADTGGTLNIAGESGFGDYVGTIDGNISLVKSGDGIQLLGGTMTHVGTTTVNGGVLRVDGTHTGAGVYTVGAGGTLGGNGFIDSGVLVNPGGQLSPGASAGTLSLNNVALASGSAFNVEIGGVNAGLGHDQLLTDSATLGGVLNVSLLSSGQSVYEPSPTDTFTISVSSSSLSGMFDNVVSRKRIETIGGEGTFQVTYGTSSKTVVLSDFEPSLLDFGDAPETYGTLRADDGARHVAIGPQLGASRDVEGDGVPTATANGDGSDEDGALIGSIGVNSTIAAVNIELTGTSDAKVDAWIDFNRDGDWDDLNERILTNQLVNSGLQTINYDLPGELTTGDNYARVRISSIGGLSPNGFAADGEVEDYVVSIGQAPTVDSIAINGGDSQRSSVDSVQVTLDQVVDINDDGGDAFSFVHESGDVVTAIPVITESNNKTVVNFTFDPVGLRVTDFGSLENGDYQLIIDSSRVTHVGVELDGNGDGTTGDDYTLSAVDGFFRKYGDHSGDSAVGLSDFAAFRQSFGKSHGESGYLDGLDSDGNNTIGLSDFAAFRQSFGS